MSAHAKPIRGSSRGRQPPPRADCRALGGLLCAALMVVGTGQTARAAPFPETASTPANTEDGRYQQLLTEGEANNRAAIATGVVGGVLVLSGASLLVVAAIRHKRVIRPTQDERVTVTPTLGGV